MNLQYISDSNGKTTGVYIPIQEWIKLKSKFKGIEEEEIDIPKWHVDVVKERLENYRDNFDDLPDFDIAMDDVENEL